MATLLTRLFASPHRLPPPPPRHRPLVAVGLALALAAVLTLLASCGGGGGGGTGSTGSGDDGGNTGTAVADPQHCAPTNPYTADAEAPTVPGSLADEKAWLHATMVSDYLWSDEIPAVDASRSEYSDTRDVPGSLDRYFGALLTRRVTATGAPVDRFSFTYPTRAWRELIDEASGIGYGIEWHADDWERLQGLRIATVEAGSPAARAGLQRGDRLLAADGQALPASGAGAERAYAALFPATAQSHRFEFSRDGAGAWTASLVSASVTRNPVPAVRVVESGGRRIGYLLFTEHSASAETLLIDAIATLRDQRVDDLVLDLRYNGGGYLYVASALAYMVAGPERTAGRDFERLTHNARRRADDSAMPFLDTSCIIDADFNCTRVAPLPTLGLGRVAVIATASTCSASETIVNGLRGIDVDVRLFGDTTCGKPYGLTAHDNCGISYFPIEFSGVNDAGFGDYADGFAPTCAAADDLDGTLGDAGEGLLGLAISHLATGQCLPMAADRGRRSPLAAASSAPGVRPRLGRPPAREAAVR